MDNGERRQFIARLLAVGIGVYVVDKMFPELFRALDSPLPLQLPSPPPRLSLPEPNGLNRPSPPNNEPTPDPPGTTDASLAKSPPEWEATLAKALEKLQQPIRLAAPIVDRPTDYALAQLMPESGVVVTIGHRDSGKTALNMRMQELGRDRLTPYAVGLPAGADRNLPDWYGLANSVGDVPNRSSIYVAESHRSFHARTTQSAQGRSVSDLVNLVRHRRQLLFFDVQNAAHLDRNIVSEADVLLIKEPGPFIQGFDRPELREHVDAARAAFAAISPARRKRAIWVVAPAAGIYGKLMENALPSFWSDRISRSFASVNPSLGRKSDDRSTVAPGTVRRAQPRNRDDLRMRARRLRDGGHTYGEIAKMLGVSKTQAYRLVSER